jgi:hypothetical protein
MAGLTADPWQQSFLRSPSRRALLLCCRGAGKSTAAAALALVDAILTQGALVLILSPSERQSCEMALKVRNYYHAAGQPVGALKETELELRLQNGSRIVALPGTERTVRSYQGVHRLIIDEAARVPDDLYRSVRPMVGVSGGSILALSTPFGRRGWFFDAWQQSRAAWQKIAVSARECPRLTHAFLAEEREALGPRWYAQEYELSFEADTGAALDPAAVAAAFRTDVKPLWT